MYAVISRDKIQLPAGTVVRMPGTWEDYCALCDSRGDGSVPRIKYRDGEILLMSPLPRHGREAHLLARIVEALLDSETRNYEAFTPITMTIPRERGIEPDFCFYITLQHIADFHQMPIKGDQQFTIEGAAAAFKMQSNFYLASDFAPGTRHFIMNVAVTFEVYLHKPADFSELRIFIGLWQFAANAFGDCSHKISMSECHITPR